MKHFTRPILCLLLLTALTASAFAAAVPVNLTVENLNGQQRMVKTYELAPGEDPEILKEPPFVYDGYYYTWAHTTKEENPFLETKTVEESVTVETAQKDLSVILEELDASIPYDDGAFQGKLVLDHNSIKTEAKGYATGYNTLTATKTIGPVDRNDMSYVPATTVRNGVTLSLSNVEWQIVGTDMVGDMLAPSAYQAVATYAGSSSYQYATGYVTTATYKGEVVSSGVESVTYTVVFTGEEIQPPEPPAPEEPEEPELPSEPEVPEEPQKQKGQSILVPILLIAVLALTGGAVAYLFLTRRNVFVYIPGGRPMDYRLVAKYRVDPRSPGIDISGLNPYPEDTVAVEIKGRLAKKLAGREFTVRHRDGEYVYPVQSGRSGDWHEFDIREQEETE